MSLYRWRSSFWNICNFLLILSPTCYKECEVFTQKHLSVHPQIIFTRAENSFALEDPVLFTKHAGALPVPVSVWTLWTGEEHLDPPDSLNSFRGSPDRSLITTTTAPSRPLTGKVNYKTDSSTMSSAQINIVWYNYSLVCEFYIWKTDRETTTHKEHWYINVLFIWQQSKKYLSLFSMNKIHVTIGW